MMVEFYSNKYRLKEWDYSALWWYCITIYTIDHKYFSGDAVNDKLFLNNIGNLVEECWLIMPKYYQNVKLDYQQVMPNHFHRIIMNELIVETEQIVPNLRDVHSLSDAEV